MIDLYYAPTPNGHKVTIFLEECGIDYRILPVDIRAGEQFNPEFLVIAPNNRIPAIVDQAPADGGAPIPIFESGAILTYLAEKHRRFLPTLARDKANVMKWLFWQMAGLGPMAGQNGHFRLYAPEKVPYAIDRYFRETNRLYGVLDNQLSEGEFVAGDYSIADMAIYPWIVPWKAQGQMLEDFPHIARWFATIRSRPAVIRAYEKGEALKPKQAEFTEEQRKLLFGQSAKTIRP